MNALPAVLYSRFEKRRKFHWLPAPPMLVIVLRAVFGVHVASPPVPSRRSLYIPIASYGQGARLDADATRSPTGDPRLRWLGIASGLWANSQDLRQYRTQYKVTIPLTLDASGQVFRAFRVNEVPTVLIADAGGRIVRRIEGSAAQDGAALRTAIDSL